VTLTTEVVRFGPQAVEALSGHLAEAQRDDPLAPVIVVVSRPTVGLALRRRLAAQPPGVVNVRFLTLGQLSEELGGPSLVAAGRQPASPAAVHAAVRASLAARREGPLHPVRHHPATERAVVGVLRDLSGCDEGTLERLARLGGRPAAVVEVVLDVRRRLAGWYDPAAAALAAAAAVDAGRGPGRAPGHLALPTLLVLHLPAAITSAQQVLVAALARHAPVVALLGATGDPAADEPTVALARRLGASPEAPGFPVGGAPLGTRVLSAPSADSEVLLAVRGVMDHQRRGVPLARMAVVHGGVDPYPRVLHESFDLAGIPVNGPGVRPLSATMVGRTLLGALALPDHEWRRDEVLAWLSGGPVRQRAGGVTVAATRWDQISRRAGVTSGQQGWLDHLDRYGAELAAELDAPAPADDEETQRRRERRQADLGHLAELREFLVELGDHLRPDVATTWQEWARWADRFLRRYLRPSPWWPLDELQALDEVVDLLARLSVLDQVDPAPDATTFRRALESELDAAAPGTRRFGRGVLIGPVETVVGLDLDVLFVVGMTETAFPGRVPDDPLLSDDERLAADEDLPRRSDRNLQAPRTYLAALAAAPERVLSYARGDQRRGREQRPSRWLLDAVGAQAGRRLFSRDLPELGPVPGFEWIPSLTAAVRSPLEPASLADRDLRSLLAWFEAGHPLDDHPLAAVDPVLRLGLAARHDRRQPGFTRFDGLVARVEAPSPLAHRALAPTSLENYATCPRRYFLRNVLRVDVPQRPEEVQRISRLDWGNLVHRVLERFIDDQVSRPRPERIQPDQRWSADDRQRLDRITGEVCAEFEQRGLTGRALLWDLDRVAIRRDLHAFLDADDHYRATYRVVPERAELHFGSDDATPVTVELRGERRLRFKGSADRVDLGDDGSIVVLDYKTGSDRGYRDIEAGDPTVRGTKLQLPIYGLAAASRFGDGPVASAYWFVSQRGNFDRVSYPLDPQGRARFEEVLGVMVDGIESGSFPPHPGDESTRIGTTFTNCTYCDFDAICPTDRDREWERVRHAPEVAAYAEMADGPDDGPAT
jgi:ATP-dependent helicase/nuclease subunit B